MGRANYSTILVFAVAAIAFLFLKTHVTLVLRGLTGYSAKTACTAYFVSGHPKSMILTEDVSGVFSYPTLEFDDEKRVVRSSIFGGFFAQEAQALYYFGCVRSKADSYEIAPALPDLRRFKTGEVELPSDEDLFPLGNKTESVADEALENEGVHVGDMNEAGDRFFNEFFGDEYKLNTRALLVVHRDRIVYERYGKDIHAGTKLRGWSMTKSLTNTLIGARIHQEKLSLDDVIAESDLRTTSPTFANITVRDLLQMDTGLIFEETYPVHRISEVVNMLFVNTDTANFALRASLAHQKLDTPEFRYSSGTTNLLSQRLRRSFGSDEEYWRFPRSAIFNPLRMSSMLMEVDGTGTFVGSSFSVATARDWARLGMLYKKNGNWFGQQILDPEFVKFSTTPNPDSPHSFHGAHIWLNVEGLPGTAPDVPSAPRDAYFFRGYEHQYVVVVPSKDLVIVRLGQTDRNASFDADRLFGPLIAAFPDAADRT